MAIASGEYKRWRLVCVEPYEGMSAFFVVAPGPDPKMIWGIRRSWDEAILAGRQTITQEAEHAPESSSRDSR